MSNGADDRLSIVYLEKIEPDANAYRYYVLSVEPTLFEEMSLVREWGRIGQGGRRIVELLPDAVKARMRLDAWLTKKRRRGYAERASKNAG